jgi:hypothetical protein
MPMKDTDAVIFDLRDVVYDSGKVKTENFAKIPKKTSHRNYDEKL